MDICTGQEGLNQGDSSATANCHMRTTPKLANGSCGGLLVGYNLSAVFRLKCDACAKIEPPFKNTLLGMAHFHLYCAWSCGWPTLIGVLKPIALNAARRPKRIM